MSSSKVLPVENESPDAGTQGPAPGSPPQRSPSTKTRAEAGRLRAQTLRQNSAKAIKENAAGAQDTDAFRENLARVQLVRANTNKALKQRNEDEHASIGTKLLHLPTKTSSKNLLVPQASSKAVTGQNSPGLLSSASIKNLLGTKPAPAPLRTKSDRALANYVDNEAYVTTGNRFRTRLGAWKKMQGQDLRRAIEIFLVQTRLNLVLLSIELAASAISVVLLVYMSYWDQNPEETLTAVLRIRPLWLAEIHVVVGSIFALWCLCRMVVAPALMKHVTSYDFMAEMLSAFPLIRDVMTIQQGTVLEGGIITYPDTVGDGLLLFCNFCEACRGAQLFKIRKVLALLNNDVIREGTELYTFSIVAILVLGSLFSFFADLDVYAFSEDGIMATVASNRKSYAFIDYLYGCVVSSVTLGYGEVHPQGFLEQV